MRGPLSVPTQALAAASNANYGYWGGGGDTSGPAITSRIERIDFSNDTPSSSPKGPLSRERRYLSATGNTSYGYWGGDGPPGAATNDRLDYSNDTVATVSRGPLSAGRYGLFAASAAANANPQ